MPREVFEQLERPALQPAPQYRFDLPVWSRAKVHPDHHVQLARALYSVPHAYLGQTLDARVDRTSVRLYRSGVVVKCHPRVAPGQRSTDPSDYPVGRAGYAQRSIAGLLARSAEYGVYVGRFTAKLLDGPLPWTRMRQAYGLLRLCDRYGAARVDAYCVRIPPDPDTCPR